MVLSMTGYGRAEQERSGRDITVEIKSVNSRYFEYTSRMPRSFAFLDDKLKKLVNATISRGKTELALTVVNIGAPEASISVNLDLAKGYLDAIGEMSSALGVENDVTAGTLTRFSDIFTTRKAETDEEQLWADVKAVAEAAVENFVAMRAAEGEKLEGGYPFASGVSGAGGGRDRADERRACAEIHGEAVRQAESAAGRHEHR